MFSFCFVLYSVHFLRATAECFARLSRRRGSVCPSVCMPMSVCPSHWGIVSKRCKLGSQNFYCGLPKDSRLLWRNFVPLGNAVTIWPAELNINEPYGLECAALDASCPQRMWHLRRVSHFFLWESHFYGSVVLTSSHEKCETRK